MKSSSSSRARKLVLGLIASPCRCDHTHRTSRHVSETTTTTTTRQHDTTNNNKQQHRPSIPRVALFTMDTSGQPSSVAQRRKQRRLRSWWRHEQQSIASALATFQYHNAQRQKTARAGEVVRVEVHGQIAGEPPPQAAGTQYFLPWTMTRCLSPVSPDQACWHPCLVHKSGFSGTS